MSEPAAASPGGKSFSALASLPELGGGMKPGRMTIAAGRVRFECDALRIRMTRFLKQLLTECSSQFTTATEKYSTDFGHMREPTVMVTA